MNTSKLFSVAGEAAVCLTEEVEASSLHLYEFIQTERKKNADDVFEHFIFEMKRQAVWQQPNEVDISECWWVIKGFLHEWTGRPYMVLQDGKNQSVIVGIRLKKKQKQKKHAFYLEIMIRRTECTWGRSSVMLKPAVINTAVKQQADVWHTYVHT